MPLKRTVAITARDGRQLIMRRLTRQYATRYSTELVELHNDIPYLAWTSDDLLAPRRINGTEYLHKWDLSFALSVDQQPVGLLIAYLRDLDDTHPMRSLYIHRLAIHRKYRRLRLATRLLSHALSAYFAAMPWLLTVTVQTNDEPSNEHVIDLYERLGFRRAYRVHYPNKQDVLLDLSRETWLSRSVSLGGLLRDDIAEGQQLVASGAVQVKELRAPFYDGGRAGSAPYIYFSTGSAEKRAQYEYLFRCYGIRLRQPRQHISLAEPQVEGAGQGAEREVVTGPLKLLSRFAAKDASYPIMVEDTMLFIEEFNEEFDFALLPGPDTKRWWQALHADGLLRILQRASSRRARYVCQLGFSPHPGRYETFRSELDGAIAHDISISEEAITSFPYSNATFFHSLFIPDGSDRTLASMDSNEFNRYDYRRRCLHQSVDAMVSHAAWSEQASLFL